MYAYQIGEVHVQTTAERWNKLIFQQSIPNSASTLPITSTYIPFRLGCVLALVCDMSVNASVVEGDFGEENERTVLTDCGNPILMSTPPSPTPGRRHPLLAGTPGHDGGGFLPGDQAPILPDLHILRRRKVPRPRPLVRGGLWAPAN